MVKSLSLPIIAHLAVVDANLIQHDVVAVLGHRFTLYANICSFPIAISSFVSEISPPRTAFAHQHERNVRTSHQQLFSH